MLLSVIVATRNRASLLMRTLQAIQSQTYSNFEVLVIDDGSDTTTRAAYPALHSALDSRFQLVQVGANGQRGQGPSASRNLGIKLAQGSVLAFCDDDDVWLDPMHLAAVAQLFDEHAGIGLCISNQRAVYVDGTVREQWLPSLATLPNPTVLTNRFNLVSVNNLIATQGFGHLNMCCMRRAVVDTVGGFWEAVNYEEDRDFFWRCADAAKGVAYCATTVAQHHVPDPAQRLTVSSATQQQERWLVAAMVSRHIATAVQSQAIAQNALRLEGDLLRRLALHCAHNGQYRACALLANQALGARFSIKWAGYCVWAWLKALARP
jgi:cellulose synthase/poly-beta-1,6-N-acetylglucosamine synthase-like glycosyltransferase